MGIGKEDLDREPLGQAAHVRPSLSPNHRSRCCAVERAHVGVSSRSPLGHSRIRPFHLGQDDQTCGPFHQGADGRAIPGPLDQVAFPVAGHRAGDHLSRALGHARHSWESGRVDRPPRRGRRALRV